MAKPGQEAPGLRLAHATRGRVRYRAAGNAGREGLLALADGIMTLAGVRRVVVRPATGSVIVETDLDAEALGEAMGTAGVARILPSAPTVPVRMVTQMGLARIDRTLDRRTDGALDLKTGLALVLTVTAVAQIARGNLAGPATALLMQAYSLLEGPARR